MNYGDIPAHHCDLDGSKVVIVPVPFDGTSTWGKGSDKGPDAILEASANMELFDIETNSEPYTIGIHTTEPLLYETPEEGAEITEQKVTEFISKDKITCVIGGEHSVSIGAISAYAKNIKNLTVLQLDAHSDLRDEYHDSKYNHACVMARAQELCPIVQVGIRSTDKAEIQKADPERIFYAEKIRNNPNWIKDVVSMISDNVYITIDLDALDPSIMPSTGTPEPGGLGWYNTLDLLKEVMQNKNLVGFDVVELAPNPKEKSSDFLAAKLIYKIIAYRFFNPN